MKIILDTNFLIYCAKNKKNGKRYIGATSAKLKARQSSHKNGTSAGKLHRAIKKEGMNAFEWKILRQCSL
jgi:predicted GIY-YIG superfamily endonuclease